MCRTVSASRGFLEGLLSGSDLQGLYDILKLAFGFLAHSSGLISDAVSSASDVRNTLIAMVGVRVGVGGSCYDWYNSSCGGVAYVGSFTWNSDTPAYVFPKQLYSAKSVAEAASANASIPNSAVPPSTSTTAPFSSPDHSEFT